MQYQSHLLDIMGFGHYNICALLLDLHSIPFLNITYWIYLAWQVDSYMSEFKQYFGWANDYTRESAKGVWPNPSPPSLIQKM